MRFLVRPVRTDTSKRFFRRDLFALMLANAVIEFLNSMIFTLCSEELPRRSYRPQSQLKVPIICHSALCRGWQLRQRHSNAKLSAATQPSSRIAAASVRATMRIGASRCNSIFRRMLRTFCACTHCRGNSHRDYQACAPPSKQG